MEWARESNQDLVLLMIDFEKAYDRVNWTFLKEAMRKLGFSDEWIARTAAFYEDAKTSVLVNGIPTPEFDLERGVRQGCPMAPYLFLFAQDTLGYMLSDPVYAIEGLQLPDSSVLRESFFADDSVMFLKGTRENLERTLLVLDTFCAGSGARMNLCKSTTIWCSANQRNWTFGEDRGLTWLAPGATTFNLGFPIGYMMSQQEKMPRFYYRFVTSLLNGVTKNFQWRREF